MVAIAAVTLLSIREYLTYRANYDWPDATVLAEHCRALTSRELTKISAVGSRAVDAQFAIACVMQNERFELKTGVYNGLGRVIEVVGLFEHDGKVDDLGCLKMTDYDIKNRISLNVTPKRETDCPAS